MKEVGRLRVAVAPGVKRKDAKLGVAVAFFWKKATATPYRGPETKPNTTPSK